MKTRTQWHSTFILRADRRFELAVGTSEIGYAIQGRGVENSAMLFVTTFWMILSELSDSLPFFEWRRFPRASRIATCPRPLEFNAAKTIDGRNPFQRRSTIVAKYKPPYFLSPRFHIQRPNRPNVKILAHKLFHPRIILIPIPPNRFRLRYHLVFRKRHIPNRVRFPTTPIVPHPVVLALRLSHVALDRFPSIPFQTNEPTIRMPA